MPLLTLVFVVLLIIVLVNLGAIKKQLRDLHNDQEFIYRRLEMLIDKVNSLAKTAAAPRKEEPPEKPVKVPSTRELAEQVRASREGITIRREPHGHPIADEPAASGDMPAGAGKPPKPPKPREMIVSVAKPEAAGPEAAADTGKQPGEPSRAEAVHDILQKIWSWILVGKEYRQEGVSMEFAMASTWLLRIGIIAIVACIGYFLKWSIERQMITELGRVALSIGAGLVMLVLGTRLSGKTYDLIGSGLMGGGLAALYFSMYAAGHMYNLVPITYAFGLMILVTLTAGVVAVRTDSRLVAILGIIGGFCTPVLLRTGTVNFTSLFSYVLLLNLGILGIARFKQWRLLNYLAFFFTYALVLGALSHGYMPDDFSRVMPFLALFFVVHSSLVYLNNIIERRPSTTLEIIQLVLNAGLFTFISYFLIKEAYGRPYPAVLSVSMAAFFVVHVVLFLRKRLLDRPLLIALVGLAGAYTAWTLPLVFEQETLTLSWALLALLFMYLGSKLKSNFIHNLSLLLYIIVFYRLLTLEVGRGFLSGDRLHPASMTAYWQHFVGRLWTFGVSIASIVGAFFLQRRAPKPYESLAVDDGNDTGRLLAGSTSTGLFYWVGALLLFLVLHLELSAFLWFCRPLRMPLLTVLWVAMAACFFFKFMEAGVAGKAFFAMMTLFIFGAVVKILFVDLASWNICSGFYYDMEYTGLYVLMRLIDFAAPLLLLFILWRLLPSDRRGGANPAPFGGGALLLLFVYLTLEANSFLHFVLPDFQASGISVLWALFGITAIVGGIWKNVKPLRYFGLVLIAVVVGKVLLFDLAATEVIYRVIAFLVMGILLIIGSFAYIRSSRSFIAAVALVFCAHAAMAGVNAAQFPFYKEIVPGDHGTKSPGGVVRVELDDEIYLHADRDYGNIRILTSDRREVPFTVQTKTESGTVYRDIPVAMETISLEKLPENRLRVVLKKKRGDAPAPRTLVIDTRARNFEKNITISGSPDGTQWSPVVTRHPVFDYSRYLDLRNDRIELPSTGHRYFKIEISSIIEKSTSPLTTIVREKAGGRITRETEQFRLSEETFRIESFKFLGRRAVQKTGEPELTIHRPRRLVTHLDEGARESVLTFFTCRQPITRIVLSAGTRNYSRMVIVEGTNDTDDAAARWRHICRQRITKILLGGHGPEPAINDTEIELDGVYRYLRYRLRIQNLDNPPLEQPALSLAGEIHQILFFCEPQGSYRVYYGAGTIRKPQYEIDRILARMRTIKPAVFTLGGGTENRAYIKPALDLSLDSKAVLIAALICMVIILSWAIARAGRQVEQMDERS